MAAPVYTLPTSGSSPKYATKTGHESAINAALSALFALLDAADDALSDRISAIMSGFVAVGEWDASSGSFPSGEQTLGTFYIVPEGGAGTVDGIAFAVGDQLLPLVTNPSTTTYAGNWLKNPRSEIVDRVYDDEAALVASGEALRGEGEAWPLKNGTPYVEAAPSETDNELENSAGVKLYVADDTTSANVVGAPDGASPAARASYAPALVASMQRRLMYGVTMRDLVGRNYSEANDASTVLNSFFPELADAGIMVRDPNSLTIGFEDTIKMPPSFRFEGSLGSEWVKNSATGTFVNFDATGEVRVAAVVTSAAGATVQFTAIGLGAEVGEVVLLAAFDRASLLHSKWVTITAKSGDDYTVDAVWPSGVTVSNGEVARYPLAAHGLVLKNLKLSAGAGGAGRMVGLVGNDMLLEHLQVDEYKYAESGTNGAMYLFGDRIRVLFPRVRAEDGMPNGGTDGIRLGGGRDFICFVPDVISADDALALTNYSTDGTTGFDIDIVNARFIGGRGYARHARGFAAALTFGSDQLSANIENYLVQGVDLKSDVGSVVTILNRQSTGKISGAIRDSRVEAYGTADDAAIEYDAYNYLTTTSGGLGENILDHVTCKDNVNPHAVHYQTHLKNGSLIIGEGCEFDATDEIFDISGAEQVRIGDMIIDAGSSPATFGVGGSNEIVDLVIDGLLVQNVPTGQAAVYTQNCTNVEIRRLRAEKAAGATGTYALSIGNLAQAHIGIVTGDVDALKTGSGEAFTVDYRGFGAGVTIAAGVVTLGDGGSFAVDTEASAATDDLDTINYPALWPNGKQITLRPNSGARDVVVKDGTGNLALASDFTMDGFGDRITLELYGGTWYEIARSDNG